MLASRGLACIVVSSSVIEHTPVLRATCWKHTVLSYTGHSSLAVSTLSLVAQMYLFASHWRGTHHYERKCRVVYDPTFGWLATLRAGLMDAPANGLLSRHLIPSCCAVVRGHTWHVVLVATLTCARIGANGTTKATLPAKKKKNCIRMLRAGDSRNVHSFLSLHLSLVHVRFRWPGMLFRRLHVSIILALIPYVLFRFLQNLYDTYTQLASF